VLDILVPEVVLQRARVLAVVGKFVAAGVTQHVAKPRGYRAMVEILELAGAK
jgi:DNA integrity scanning protein DisA with diadenylate cyclase activity